MRKKLVVVVSVLFIVLIALTAILSWFPSKDFVGVMERVAANELKLRETDVVTMDPSRRPGWCFLVGPPDDGSYEVYSIHYLPGTPKSLTGKFIGLDPGSALSGIKSPVRRTDGIRRFCFDFDPGDPFGEYQVDVFINGMLKTTLYFSVITPGDEA